MPITRVPTEIWGEVFVQYLLLFSTTACRSHSSLLLRSIKQSEFWNHIGYLVSICKTWRDIVLNTPQIWSLAQIAFTDVVQYPHKTQTIVARSSYSTFQRIFAAQPLGSYDHFPDSPPRASPFNNYSEKWRTFIKDLVGTAHRICVLELHDHREGMRFAFKHIFPAMRNIVSLTLRVTDSQVNALLIPHLLPPNAHWPHLIKLNMIGISFSNCDRDDRAFPELTELYIKLHSPPAIPAAAMIKLLQSSPNLVLLVLMGDVLGLPAGATELPVDLRDEKIRLPLLRKFRLRAVGFSPAVLFRHVHTSAHIVVVESVGE